MVVSKSLIAIGGFFVVLSIVISAAFFFLSRSTSVLSPTAQNTKSSTTNAKYKVSKVPVDGVNTLYVVEGKFTQEIQSLNELSRARFLIDGEETNEVMVTFPSGNSSFSIGQKNAKGEMVWTNQPFSSIKPLISPIRSIQLRFLKSSNKFEDSAVIQLLDELVQAETIKPTYYSIQPDAIGFL